MNYVITWIFMVLCVVVFVAYFGAGPLHGLFWLGITISYIFVADAISRT